MATINRRKAHGHASKHNCNWSPKGREAGYKDKYVDAIRAKDWVQVSMCLTKDRYSSQESAKNTIVRREAITGKLLRSYHCPYCGGWHLTSKPKASAPEFA